MKGGDSGVTQELSADRSDLNNKGEGERTIGSDFFLCAQDQAQPPGRNQKDETDIEGADWLDPLADIYALVSSDKGDSPSENLKEKVRLNNTEDPKRLLNHDSPSRKCFHRNYAAKSFIKSIVAFVLVGSIFFYFVDWFSEVKKNDGGEAVQKTLKVVLKKMPAFVSNEPTSTLPDNGMEELSSKLAEEEAVIGDAKAVFDPAETQEVIKNLSSPTNGNKTADKTPSGDFQKDGTDYSRMPSIENKKIGTPPEEPDPASVIDYVLKKRGF